MKSYNRIASIIGPAQNLREFGLGHPLSDFPDLGGSFLESLFALLIFRHIEKEPGFFQRRSIFFPGVDDVFERGLFFEKA